MPRKTPSGYQRLHARDGAFLHFEKPHLPLHAGAVAIFEVGELRLPSGQLDVDRIRSHVVRRLERAPRCRQRLERAPISRAYILVDDPDFDIRNHIHLGELPAPAGEAELKAFMGDLLSRPIDKSRPLWEMWCLPLGDGERFAVAAKFHHVLADGLAAIELARILLSLSSDPSDDPGTGPTPPHPIPPRRTILRGEVQRLASAPVRAARSLAAVVRHQPARKRFLERTGGAIAMIWMALRITSSTPLNRRVDAPRRFDWTVTELSDVRRVRSRYGGSVHEVGLAIVTGALRRILAERGYSPRKLRLRAMAPTSGLSLEGLGSLGNRVEAPVVQLPMKVAGPGERVRRVSAQARRVDEQHIGLGWDVLMDITEWGGGQSQAFIMWLVTRLRPYNVILTLIPGPHAPLYLMGSKMLALYPALPLLDQQTITFGLLRYMGRLHWGVVTAPQYHDAFSDAIPHLEAAVEELLAAANEAPAPARKK